VEGRHQEDMGRERGKEPATEAVQGRPFRHPLLMDAPPRKMDGKEVFMIGYMLGSPLRESSVREVVGVHHTIGKERRSKLAFGTVPRTQSGRKVWLNQEGKNITIRTSRMVGGRLK